MCSSDQCIIMIKIIFQYNFKFLAYRNNFIAKRNARSRKDSNFETSEHHMSNNEDTNAKKKRLKYSKYIFMSIGLIMTTSIASLCLFKPKLKSNELSKQQAIRNDFLGRKILSFDDFDDKPDKSSWDKLPDDLKQIVLNSKLNFQGHSVEFKSLFNPVVLNNLTLNEINDILKGKELVTGKDMSSKVDFYIKRRFMLEDVKMMCFEFEYGHEFVYNYQNPVKFADKRTNGRNFEEFRDEFMNRTDRFEIIERVRNNEYFQKKSYDLTYESLHILNVSSDMIIEQANRTRSVVISSEISSGRTTTLQQLASQIKTKYPTKWVSYIDLKSHEKFYKADGNIDNVEELMINILDLDTGKNNFEVEVFKELFNSGNAVLFWDDFDKISTDFQDLVLNLFKIIHRNSENIQFVSTDHSSSNKLSKALKTRTLVMLPFDKDKQQEFLRKYFNFQNVPSEKVKEINSPLKNSWYTLGF